MWRGYLLGEFKDAEGIESYPVELEITNHGAGLITTLYRLHGYRKEDPQLGIAFVLPQTVRSWRGSVLLYGRCIRRTTSAGRRGWP